MDREKLEEQLHENNWSRWIGKPEYSCLTCSHSMSADNGDQMELVCVSDSVHKKVDDEHLCKEWS